MPEESSRNPTTTMKYCCPHCRHIFESLEGARCPGCSKVLRHPDKWKVTKPKSTPRTARLGNTSHLRQPIWTLFAGSRRMMIWVVGGCVVVVGFLFTLDINTGIPYQPPPKIIQTRKELLVLRTALEWYRFHCKRYPTPEEGLKALVRNPGADGWQGYYIEALPPDLWGHPFLYTSSNDVVRLSSAGPDGIAETSDDIASPQPDYKALARRLAQDKK